jgi:signal transduction histidine kinase
MVKVTVSDNGIGIKKELQKNIFDIFFRATDTAKGNGLGLYIVQNTLQKLHGAIKVKSTEGMGSSFIIYLPDAARKTNHAQRIIENKAVFPSRDEFALDYL